MKAEVCSLFCVFFRKANHPKIVEVISIHISKQNELSIVMEFMAGGNLKDLLKAERKGQGKELMVRFIEDIGSAIEHLHSLDVMHRDVKPENIYKYHFHSCTRSCFLISGCWGKNSSYITKTINWFGLRTATCYLPLTTVALNTDLKFSAIFITGTIATYAIAHMRY